MLAALSCTLQIEILVAEIPEDLQQKARKRVCLAMDKYEVEKDIATDVKKHFDEECEGSWHCVVRTAYDRITIYKRARVHTELEASFGLKLVRDTDPSRCPYATVIWCVRDEQRRVFHFIA